jgi:hypothetical protein
MTSELTNTERSRRGLLAAAAGAAAAAVVASVARFTPASAADGDAAIVGQRNEGESTTTFHAESAWGLAGSSTNSRGVSGMSEAGQGVHGESTLSAGVSGVSEQGNGVHGTSRDNRGVWGESTNGPGVDASGATGVRAASPAGLALHTTSGRVRLEGISGVAVIPSGQQEVAVKPAVALDRNTFVLLTPKANLGQKTLWYTVSLDTGEIVIHISGTRSKDTPVAYLMLEHTPAP